METIYEGDRPELLRFLSVQGQTVLDVGCGRGGLGPHLRAKGAIHLTGLEMSTAGANAARDTYDIVHNHSVEVVLDDELLRGYAFDVIILADVLEHLIDPWTVLRRLVAEHLACQGSVFISIPNVGNMAVVKQLIRRGDWRYDDSGLFDRTHLRWFGRSSLEELLNQSGLTATAWGGRLSFGFGRFWLSRYSDDVRRVPSMAIFQHHIVARRSNGAS